MSSKLVPPPTRIMTTLINPPPAPCNGQCAESINDRLISAASSRNCLAGVCMARKIPVYNGKVDRFTHPPKQRNSIIAHTHHHAIAVYSPKQLQIAMSMNYVGVKQTTTKNQCCHSVPPFRCVPPATKCHTEPSHSPSPFHVKKTSPIHLPPPLQKKKKNGKKIRRRFVSLRDSNFHCPPVSPYPTVDHRAGVIPLTYGRRSAAL